MGKNFYLNIGILLLLLGYIIIPSFFNVYADSNTYQLLVRPLLWTIVLIITLFFLKDSKRDANYNRYQIREVALIGSLVYIILYFLSGLVIGYSNSPINHNLTGIINNIFTIFMVAVIQETVRSKYINALTDHNFSFSIIFITIVFVILNIKIDNFIQAFTGVGAFMAFLCKYFVPELVSSVFFTYLAYREGLISVLLYKIPFLLIYFFTPILPSNNYAVLCIITSIIPLIMYLKIEKSYFTNFKNVVVNIVKNEALEIFKIFIFIFAAIFVIIYSRGEFKISSLAIVSKSMEPIIHIGDAVVYKKTDTNKIITGDIIVYKLDNIMVVHRVSEIKYDSNTGIIFITKGDNNRSEDIKHVEQDQIKGKVIAIIPKIGYPTVWVKGFLNTINNNPNVELGDSDG